ncbi:MAG: WYL domain-containing protein [Balneolaceae bacterium]
MERLKSSERRMKLILLLQDGRRKWTAGELADRFQVSKRTIFRDMRTLSELNVPVTLEEGGGYGIMPGYKIPPIMFTERELGTVMIGLQFVLSQVDQSLVEEAHGVALKVKEVLPDRLKRWMDSLEEHTVVDPYQRFGTIKRKGGDWYRVGAAISERAQIEFDYPESGGGDLERRTLNPYLLVYFQDHWNVIGYSHERNGIRNFILHKTSRLSILDKNFDPPDEIDVEGLIFRFDGTEKEVICQVSQTYLNRLELHLPTKLFKKERVSAKLFKVGFRFDNLPYINEWLLQFGDGIRILAPKELVQMRQSLLHRMLNES